MKLVVRAGPNAGQEFPVSKERVTIGRGMDNDVVLRDNEVSRRHAEIHQTAEGYTITDLNSTNGTFVNDTRVTAPEPLYPEDKIRVGTTILSFEEGVAAPISKAEFAPPVVEERNLFPFFLIGGTLVLAAFIIILTRQPGQVVTIPTPTAVVTPTVAPAILTATPVPSQTPTLSPAPTTTLTPVVLCPNPNARITSPLPGAKITGIVEIHGTAFIDDFAFYKLECGVGRFPPVWSLIGELHYAPTRDGRLAIWDTTVLPEGDYILRLTVVDNTGNYPPPCEVTVSIKK